ncbi:MAG TPA: hypothetical protein VIG40_03130 [Tissierellaceae bacterium]
MSQHKNLTIQSEGFPATIETWNVLNDSIQHALSVSAGIIGSNAILSGCNQYNQGNDTYVSDGVITVDKKVFSFKGGKKTTGVTVITEKTSAVYDTNSEAAKEMLPVYEFSYATNAGSGQSLIPWDSFVRVADLKGLNDLIPKVDNVWENRVIDSGTIKFNIHIDGDVNWSVWKIELKEEHQDYLVLLNLSSDTSDVGQIIDFINYKVYDKKLKSFMIIACPTEHTMKKLDGYSYNHQIDWCVIKKGK